LRIYFLSLIPFFVLLNSAFVFKYLFSRMRIKSQPTSLQYPFINYLPRPQQQEETTHATIEVNNNPTTTTAHSVSPPIPFSFVQHQSPPQHQSQSPFQEGQGHSWSDSPSMLHSRGTTSEGSLHSAQSPPQSPNLLHNHIPSEAIQLQNSSNINIKPSQLQSNQNGMDVEGDSNPSTSTSVPTSTTYSESAQIILYQAQKLQQNKV
jgi:hypothetical protein